MRINSGQPQLYGTQIIINNPQKGYELKPVFEPGKLNERRTAMKLSAIEEYLEKANKLFFEINKEKIAKP